MNILQLGKFWPVLGGVEKVMYDLALGFSQRGFRSDMMCAASEGDSTTIPLNEYGSVFAFKSLLQLNKTMISPGMISGLRKIASDYDIIHIHHPDPMAALALYLSGYKGKVILHWHSDILSQKVMLRAYRPLQSWLLRRADRVICTSPNYAEGSASLRSVKDKLLQVPIGCEPVRPSQPMVAQLREQAGNRKIIFSVGRLIPYKGYDNLILAAERLPSDYLIVIAGAGPLERQLKELISSKGLAHKVRLLGRISDDERNAWMGAADAFCLPSVYKTEAYGIVMIEAMSAGLPVIATEIPGSGTSYVNAHRVSGLNAPCGNPDRLAEAIVGVVDNDETRRIYGRQAYDRWKSHFTIGTMLDRMEAIYRSVLPVSPPPPTDA